MSGSFNASVAISGFTLNLNPVVVAGGNGHGQQIARSEKRGLLVSVANYSASNKYLGNSPITFDAEPTEAVDGEHSGLVGYEELLTDTEGTDVKAAFNSSLFDTIQATWPAFDPTVSTGGDVARYFRLDRVEATLPMHSVREANVMAAVGVYDLPIYRRAITYLPIRFLGGHRLRQRQQNVDTLQANIAEAEATLTSTTDEAQRQQLQAQIDQWQQQFDALEAEYVAPLTDLLSVAEIKSAVGAMSQQIWIELKAKHLAYANLDTAAKETNFSGYYDSLVAAIA